MSSSQSSLQRTFPKNTLSCTWIYAQLPVIAHLWKGCIDLFLTQVLLQSPLQCKYTFDGD